MRQQGVANTLTVAPRLCPKLPADISSVHGREEVMAVPRVKTLLLAFGNLLSAVHSVFSGVCGLRC